MRQTIDIAYLPGFAACPALLPALVPSLADRAHVQDEGIQLARQG